jgi:hypothetical protein
MNIQVNQNGKKCLWPVLLIGVLFLSICTVFAFHFLKEKTHSKMTVSHSEALWEIPGIQPGSLYQRLRSVEVLDNRFVLLKHIPTAQRVMVIVNKQNDQSVYQTMFDQELTPMAFTMLIQLFKHHTQFENKSIQIDSVIPVKSGALKTKKFKISYRCYDITARVNQKPQYFETYLGKIEEGVTVKAILFTFNTRHYVSLAPITDLTKGLEPTK